MRIEYIFNFVNELIFRMNTLKTKFYVDMGKGFVCSVISELSLTLTSIITNEMKDSKEPFISLVDII
jgi:hypothetical protein